MGASNRRGGEGAEALFRNGPHRAYTAVFLAISRRFCAFDDSFVIHLFMSRWYLVHVNACNCVRLFIGSLASGQLHIRITYSSRIAAVP